MRLTAVLPVRGEDPIAVQAYVARWFYHGLDRLVLGTPDARTREDFTDVLQPKWASRMAFFNLAPSTRLPQAYGQLLWYAVTCTENREQEYVVVLDQDSWDPRDSTPIMSELRAGEAETDVFMGRRTVQWGRPLRARLTTAAARTMLRRVAGLRCSDPTCGYRWYRASLLHQLGNATLMAWGVPTRLYHAHLAYQLQNRRDETSLDYDVREFDCEMAPSKSQATPRDLRDAFWFTLTGCFAKFGKEQQ